MTTWKYIRTFIHIRWVPVQYQSGSREIRTNYFRKIVVLPTLWRLVTVFFFKVRVAFKSPFPSTPKWRPLGFEIEFSGLSIVALIVRKLHVMQLYLFSKTHGISLVAPWVMRLSQCDIEFTWRLLRSRISMPDKIIGFSGTCSLVFRINFTGERYHSPFVPATPR